MCKLEFLYPCCGKKKPNQHCAWRDNGLPCPYDAELKVVKSTDPVCDDCKASEEIPDSVLSMVTKAMQVQASNVIPMPSTQPQAQSASAERPPSIVLPPGIVMPLPVVALAPPPVLQAIPVIGPFIHARAVIYDPVTGTYRYA